MKDYNIILLTRRIKKKKKKLIRDKVWIEYANISHEREREQQMIFAKTESWVAKKSKIIVTVKLKKVELLMSSRRTHGQNISYDTVF